MNENIYASFKPASCFPDCWCELPRFGNYILEPGNTWSNLAFIFCGLIIWLYFSDFPRKKTIAASFIFLGLGSMAFHGTVTFIGQTFDLFGMYLVVSFFIFYLLNPNFKTIYWVLLNLVLLSLIYFYPIIRHGLFAVQVILLVGLSFKLIKSNKYLWGSIFTMIIAQVVWNLDRLKIVCDPNSPINGHFFWHLLSALSAILYLQVLRYPKFLKK